MDDLTLLKAVEEFYNSAWDKLIYSGILAIAIVGVLMPVLIQWWQKNALLVQEKNIEQNAKEYVRESMKGLAEEIKKQMTARFVLELAEKEGFNGITELICKKVSEVAENHVKNAIEVQTHLFDFSGNLLAQFPQVKLKKL